MKIEELAEPVRKLLDCYDNNRVANLPNKYPNMVEHTDEFYEIIDHLRFSYGRYEARIDTEKNCRPKNYESYLATKGIRA